MVFPRIKLLRGESSLATTYYLAFCQVSTYNMAVFH